MRKVIVSKMVLNAPEGQPGLGKWALQPVGEAVFHQFGVDYEEFETGPGNYSTGIVEWPDGKVEGIPVHHLQFVEPVAAGWPKGGK